MGLGEVVFGTYCEEGMLSTSYVSPNTSPGVMSGVFCFN